jgi:hypothetical protein
MDLTTDPHSPSAGSAAITEGMSRRGVLRLIGGGAALAVLPGLTACDDRDLKNLSLKSPKREAVIGQGGWCWFHSPRASIGSGKLWYGSVVSGGHPRDGDVEVTAVDLSRLTVAERYVVGHTKPDDHAAPSVMMLSSGRPQVAWSTHSQADWFEVGDAGKTLRRVVRPNTNIAPARRVSYTSAHVVGGARWMLYRGEKFSWNLMTSTDGGRTWGYRGLVVDTSGGQRPYIVAASDGSRLHVMVTDGNPTEYRGTNVRYITVGSDYVIRNNEGAKVGVVGADPVKLSRVAKLLAGVAGPNGELTDTDGWICDVQIIDNRPTAILSLRDQWPAGSSKVGTQRHRYLWARQRGDGKWTIEHLAWAGSELYVGQPDYSGLGSLDPVNAQRVMVSTNVHPVTGVPLRSTRDNRIHWELWEGYRNDQGRWSWKARTANSTEDNLRPIIVANGTSKAMLWMRGTYRSWLDYDTRVVIRTY